MSNELNARVCRKMGIEPIQGLLDAHYPNLLTEEWAGRLLAMLAARRIEFELNHAILHNLTPESGNWGIRILPKRIDYCADTLAEAVCRAIDAMPEAKL